MFHDAVEEPASLSPAELRTAYEAELRVAIEENGLEAVSAAAGVDEATLAALADDEAVDLTLSEAAAVVATREDVRDAETVVLEMRDHLLMGMATGVLDVDAVAANVDLDLSGQEVQQAIEGRTPVTLAQLAAIHRFVASRNDR
jgi:tartrate dehydratase beta subunit/fumarate hydratase class I family protein